MDATNRYRSNSRAWGHPASTMCFRARYGSPPPRPLSLALGALRKLGMAAPFGTRQCPSLYMLVSFLGRWARSGLPPVVAPKNPAAHGPFGPFLGAIGRARRRNRKLASGQWRNFCAPPPQTSRNVGWGGLALVVPRGWPHIALPGWRGHGVKGYAAIGGGWQPSLPQINHGGCFPGAKNPSSPYPWHHPAAHDSKRTSRRHTNNRQVTRPGC